MEKKTLERTRKFVWHIKKTYTNYISVQYFKCSFIEHDFFFILFVLCEFRKMQFVFAGFFVFIVDLLLQPMSKRYKEKKQITSQPPKNSCRPINSFTLKTSIENFN